jgi:tetratricopeptide (TPR) repeat protein
LSFFANHKAGMQFAFTPSSKKLFAIAAFAAIIGYSLLALREFSASILGDRPNLASLTRATWLAPSNAAYHYRLGRFQFLVSQDPLAALASFREAVRWNPHNAQYWLAFAQAQQWLGDLDQQQYALERAIAADPTTPDVAWQAGNLYLIRGQTDRALHEFSIVMANDETLAPAALQLAWRVAPDVDSLLEDVIPHTQPAYLAFLGTLLGQKQTDGAAKVWSRIAALQQPLDLSHVFDYIRYLIAQHEIDQAQIVWRQTARLNALAAYLPSSQNLLVNGDFSQPVLNGGFDWLYQKKRDIALAIDPAQPHNGHNSLLIDFDGQGADESGLRQLVVVGPNSNYDFSASFKVQDMEGAGGPLFRIEDFYSGQVLFSSELLTDSESWKPTGASFQTGPDTRLVLLHVVRVPSSSPLRGKLWIADLRLTVHPEGGRP